MNTDVKARLKSNTVCLFQYDIFLVFPIKCLGGFQYDCHTSTPQLKGLSLQCWRAEYKLHCGVHIYEMILWIWKSCCRSLPTLPVTSHYSHRINRRLLQRKIKKERMNLSAFNHTKMLGCIRTFKTAAKSFRKILEALNEWFHACNLGVMVKNWKGKHLKAMGE